jgi:cysteine desulfurase family protein
MVEIYLNNAATSWPKPEEVYIAVDTFLRQHGASQGRGEFKRSREATDIIENCRRKLAEFLNAEDPTRVVFTKNCSEALNIAIKGVLRRGDHVITSSMEHNSVWRPLKTLEQKGWITLSEIRCSERGEIDLDAVKDAFQPSTRLLVCTHASNVTGTIFPLAELSELSHTNRALFLVDTAQTAGVLPLDVDELGIDLLAASGHKGLLGPQGTGVLYIAPDLILETLMEGGTGSNSLSPFQPADLPGRFEVGTHNGPGIAGLGAALDFILKTGIKEIRAKEHKLTGLLIEQLQQIPNVVVYGPRDPDQQVGVVSFNILDVYPEEVGSVLDEAYNIMVRTGLHCAPQAHRTIGTIERGTVRVSPSFFNTEDEITYFIQAIREIALQAESTSSEIRENGDYLDSYHIRKASPCFSDGSRVRVVASLPRNITELFPYLNAVLRGDFNNEGMFFTFSYGGRPIVLQAQRVTVGKTEDLATAEEILDAVLRIINKVAAQRKSIVPTTKPQIQLSPFAVYQHLPRTNCKECGELTCLAFAAGVIQGQHTLEQCSQLKEEGNAVIQEKLADYLAHLLPTGDEFQL